jgi:hypothetical protein
MKVVELLKHPVTALSVVVGAVGQLGFAWFDPVWSLLSATAGTWFPIASVVSATILPEIGYSGLATPILLGSAILFVAVQLDRLEKKVRKWLENR